MNLVPLEMLAKAIGPRHEVENIGGAFEIKQPEGVFAGNLFPTQRAQCQVGYPCMITCVNQLSDHG
jgi:hypothetical protein